MFLVATGVIVAILEGFISGTIGGIVGAISQEVFRGFWSSESSSQREEPFPPRVQTGRAEHGPTFWQSADLPENLLQALGNSSTSEEIRALVRPLLDHVTASHNHSESLHYIFDDQGVELAFDKRERRLSSILLLPSHDPDLRKTLPGKINFSMSREEVSKLLRTDRPHTGFGDTDCYPNSHDEFCIVYEPGLDSEQGNDKIRNIVLQLVEQQRWRLGIEAFSCSPGWSGGAAPPLSKLLGQSEHH